MADPSYILVAEDEAGQAEVLRYNLEGEGFRVAVAADGATALEMVAEEAPDLLVLDWMLPEMSGINIMRKLRSNDDTRSLPVIMLTARGEEDDRVRGFEVGVDDYVVKPYLPSELIARIRAVLRRARPELHDTRIVFQDIKLDLERKKVTRGKDTVHLSPTEFRLLRVFLARPGRVFSRNQLLDLAWGSDVYVEDRTVDVAMRRLRKALNDGGKPDLFRTVRSEGYALEDGA